MQYPRWFIRRMLLFAVHNAEADRVREWLAEGADPNTCTKKGTPVLVLAVKGFGVDADVVKALLDNGADPWAADARGLTALDLARRRLRRYEGKPRKPPRRCPSLTPGGELNLQDHEWEFIDRMEAEHPGFAETYLEARRRVAERTLDPRGNLERIVALFESLPPPAA